MHCVPETDDGTAARGNDWQGAVGRSWKRRARRKSRRRRIQRAVKSKFPSLEEQKLADLIWRRLRLELEPLSETDAQRVEALGYAGGVMVKYGRGELRANGEYGEIMFGDILVGLHVWPTPSLQDVATVLGRDDLGEFSPLKFYTVRANSEGNTKKDAAKDIVLTGRISIPVDRGQKRGVHLRIRSRRQQRLNRLRPRVLPRRRLNRSRRQMADTKIC